MYCIVLCIVLYRNTQYYIIQNTYQVKTQNLRAIITLAQQGAGRMKVGYARVSTKGQTPENQISKLAETGCELFFEEKPSGAKKRRPALEAMLEQIPSG